MPILCISCYNGSLVTWTVVRLTTAKIKPLIFFYFTLYGLPIETVAKYPPLPEWSSPMTGEPSPQPHTQQPFAPTTHQWSFPWTFPFKTSALLISYSFIHQLLYSLLLGRGLFFSSVIIFTQMADSLDERSAHRKAPTYIQDNINTEQKHTQTSMPWVGIEPTIPALERAKKVHALDRAATVIGSHFMYCS
jgi:hypothetical protein